MILKKLWKHSQKLNKILKKKMEKKLKTVMVFFLI